MRNGINDNSPDNTDDYDDQDRDNDDDKPSINKNVLLRTMRTRRPERINISSIINNKSTAGATTTASQPTSQPASQPPPQQQNQ